MPKFKIKLKMNGYESAPISEEGDFADEVAIQKFYSTQNCSIVSVENLSKNEVPPQNVETQPVSQTIPEVKVSEYFEFSDNGRKYRVNLKNKEVEVQSIVILTDLSELKDYYVYVSGSLTPQSISDYFKTKEDCIAKKSWIKKVDE